MKLRDARKLRSGDLVWLIEGTEKVAATVNDILVEEKYEGRQFVIVDISVPGRYDSVDVDHTELLLRK